MELWIRSQDRKKFMKVDYVYLEREMIVGYCQSTFTSPVLATYKTEEKALKVLDEIQKLILPKAILHAKPLLSTEDMAKIQKKYDMEVLPSCVDAIYPIPTSIVYEMPKK